MSITKEKLVSVRSPQGVFDKIPQCASVSVLDFVVTFLSEVRAACERESQASEQAKTLNVVVEDGGQESVSTDFSFINTKSVVHLLERPSNRPVVQASPTQSDVLPKTGLISASASTLPSVQASPTQSDVRLSREKWVEIREKGLQTILEAKSKCPARFTISMSRVASIYLNLHDACVDLAPIAGRGGLERFSIVKGEYPSNESSIDLPPSMKRPKALRRGA